MHKRTLYRLWRISRAGKTWILVLLCAVMAVATILLLRRNYAQMVNLREAVYQADEQGRPVEEVETALQALRAHVTSHMNTNLRSGDLAIKEAPIQLSGLYNQAYAAEKERVSRVNADLYTVAQAECEKQFPIGLSGSGRIPCIEQYVNQHGERIRDVPREAYMFDFISPRWSPDAAGLSLVFTIILIVLVASKILLERLVRMYVHSRHG